MKKLKLYLDTSVISHLLAEDVPDKMKDTLKLWEDIKQDVYTIYLSDVTLEEINACGEPKRSQMTDFLADIEYSLLSISQDVEQLAEKLIEIGILKRKSFDDCLHIATAIVNSCDYIVSWNFKHLVNIKTINGVRAIANLEGYKQIDLITPTMLTQGDDSDG